MSSQRLKEKAKGLYVSSQGLQRCVIAFRLVFLWDSQGWERVISDSGAYSWGFFSPSLSCLVYL